MTWDANTETDLSHYIVYGGTDTLQPVTVLQTSETTAEAFLPEFPADQQIYLHITAEDVPGNESLISSRVSGIPQPATVTYIEPNPSGTLLYDDNQLSIHFSQPLSDVGTVTATSLVYTAMDLEASYSSADTAIKITVNDPWASLDTVTFTLNNILDWAGNGTDEKTAEFTTYLLSDYNNDFTVNVLDLSSFVSAWNNNDYSYELGPVTGTIPHFIPQRNESYDLRDVMVFTRMWHYSYGTTALLAARYEQVGPDVNIYQDGQYLVFQGTKDVNAAKVILSYPETSKEVHMPEEITSEGIIRLSHRREGQGLTTETAFITDSLDKNIRFKIESLDRDNAIFDIDYIALDNNGGVLFSGRKTMDVIAVPDDYALHPNYPNPFNPLTRVNYDIPKDGPVELIVFDILGREVITLMDANIQAGYHTMTWRGLNKHRQGVAAGVYFFQLRSKDFTRTIKMLLLK